MREETTFYLGTFQSKLFYDFISVFKLSLSVLCQISYGVFVVVFCLISSFCSLFLCVEVLQ